MVEACKSMVQRIAKEWDTEKESNGAMSFSSPCLTINKGKPVPHISDFDKNILMKSVMSYYDSRVSCTREIDC
jgi:hypothetical protein